MCRRLGVPPVHRNAGAQLRSNQDIRRGVLNDDVASEQVGTRCSCGLIRIRDPSNQGCSIGRKGNAVAELEPRAASRQDPGQRLVCPNPDLATRSRLTDTDAPAALWATYVDRRSISCLQAGPTLWCRLTCRLCLRIPENHPAKRTSGQKDLATFQNNLIEQQ